MNTIKKYKNFIKENSSEEIEGGKSSGMSLIDIAKKHVYKNPSSREDINSMHSLLTKQLEIGTSVEAEHTGDERVAREIAMDHLEEDPYYYEKLGKAGLID